MRWQTQSEPYTPSQPSASTDHPRDYARQRMNNQPRRGLEQSDPLNNHAKPPALRRGLRSLAAASAPPGRLAARWGLLPLRPPGPPLWWARGRPAAALFAPLRALRRAPGALAPRPGVRRRPSAALRAAPRPRRVSARLRPACGGCSGRAPPSPGRAAARAGALAPRARSPCPARPSPAAAGALGRARALRWGPPGRGPARRGSPLRGVSRPRRLPARSRRP